MFSLYHEHPEITEELKNAFNPKIKAKLDNEIFIKKIKNASNNLVFKYLVFGVIVITFLVRSNIQTNIYLALIFSFGLSYLYLENGRMEEIIKDNDNTDNVDKLNEKLNEKYELMFSNSYNSVLYMNPALVKVFINLLPFARFNSRNFKESLMSANQLIRVYESAKKGQKIPNQTIDIAEALQRNILNNMQSIIHSFPSTVIADYRFQVNLEILQKILQKIINDIKLIYDTNYDENGPNIDSPPPNLRAGPWGNPLNSKEYNKYFNFYY